MENEPTKKKNLLRHLIETVAETVSSILEGLFFYAISAGGIAIAICSYSMKGHKLLVGAVLLVVALASLLTGYFPGFLFGIPKYNAAQQNNDSLTPNTNLTDISDWLTKIIIGL